jgi:hypothetical protein
MIVWSLKSLLWIGLDPIWIYYWNLGVYEQNFEKIFIQTKNKVILKVLLKSRKILSNEGLEK